MTPTTTTRPIARARLRAWLEARIANLDKADVTELMPEMVEEFKHDEDFVEQVFNEVLYAWAVQEARLILAQGRNGRPRKARIVEAGGVLQTAESFEEEAGAKTFDWNEWWVNAGRYVRLPKMNKAELLLSIDRDRTKLKTERVSLRFRQKLAERMPDDEEVTVEDVLAPGEIEALHGEAENEIAREDSR